MTKDFGQYKYLNFILNPIDGLCNLKCLYCYSRQNIGDKNVVGKKLAELPIRKWFPIFLDGISSLALVETVTFTWHGGEPLLLPDKFYLQMFELQKKFLGNKFKYNNVIQTNGTLLSYKRALFFLKLGFDIGISIDGPEFEQNNQRFRTKADFEKFKNNLFNLSKKKIPFAVFMVVHEGNINSEKSILSFLKELSPENGVSFVPRFNIGSYLSPKKYSLFLTRLFDLWWPERRPYIAIYENFINGLEGKTPRFCFLNNLCRVFVSLDSQGTLYSTCQPRKEVKIGKIAKKNIKDLISRHNLRVKEIMDKIENNSLCDYLGGASKYNSFSGKGCLKRLSGNNDPYIESFAEVIKYIEKNKKR